MSEDRHQRTRLLWPDRAIEELGNKTVLVAGLGGVGSWAVEALARAGIGRLILVDDDRLTPSNLNRQLYALGSTMGQSKCDAATNRVLDIDPAIDLICFKERLEAGRVGDLLDRCPAIDYLIDAIDSLAAKADLIATALDRDIPVISSMGTGNRLDPLRLCVTDLAGTKGDPLARRVRHLLRGYPLDKVKVVCSQEAPVKPGGEVRAVGSTPFVPPVAGFFIASEVIGDLVLRGNNG